MDLYLIIYFVYKNLVVVIYFLRSGCYDQRVLYYGLYYGHCTPKGVWLATQSTPLDQPLKSLSPCSLMEGSDSESITMVRNTS